MFVADYDERFFAYLNQRCGDSRRTGTELDYPPFIHPALLDLPVFKVYSCGKQQCGSLVVSDLAHKSG